MKSRVTLFMSLRVFSCVRKIRVVRIVKPHKRRLNAETYINMRLYTSIYV